ncbi:MAG: hypothetical protein U9R51_08110 [Actinomycetota bacterium]|nr:hypothetical protein [Actinomycetota bacterium]
MPRREQPSQVRPLLPDNDVPGQPHAPTRRTPGASVAVAAAAVVLALMFVIFGAGGGDDIPAPDPDQSLVAAEAADVEVTATTLPERLSDMVPVETNRLATISRSGDPRMVLWLPSERVGRTYRLQNDPQWASFDATGEFIAYLDPQWTLFAGPVPGDSAPQVEAMVSGARFHPTETAELAYTAPIAGSDSTGVYRVHVSPDILGSLEPELVGSLSETAHLLTWGDWGYAVSLDRAESPAIMILDPDGRAMRIMPGVAYSAGGDAMFVDATGEPFAGSGDPGLLAPLVVVPKSSVGIFDRMFEPIYLFPGTDARTLNVAISPDGLQIADSTFTNTGGTSVTIRDRSVDTLRTVRIDSVAHPIGFVADGTHLAMQDVDSGELIFLNWRTGAHYRLSGLTGDFVAVDL